MCASSVLCWPIGETERAASNTVRGARPHLTWLAVLAAQYPKADRLAPPLMVDADPAPKGGVHCGLGGLRATQTSQASTGFTCKALAPVAVPWLAGLSRFASLFLVVSEKLRFGYARVARRVALPARAEMSHEQRVRANPTPSDSERACFYRAALVVLRYIEQRRPSGRRFGSEADAQWGRMRGHLETADRIDLLLRDADREWLNAFSPRVAFGLAGVVGDEPFGAEWSPLDTVVAEELWRDVVAAPPPADFRAAVQAVGGVWGLSLKVAPSSISPSDKVLVAGPSAISAVASAFAGAPGLDWADQVLIVATPPAHRQLAAIGAALVNATKGTMLLSTESKSARNGLAGCRLVVSADADPSDAAWAGASGNGR